MKRISRQIACMLFALVAAAAFHPLLGAAERGRDDLAAPTTRQELDTVLARARQAMKAGQLDKADRLLGAAESSKVEYPRLTFGDTPARVRKDWQKQVDASKSANRPRFNPLKALTGGDEQPATDPFLKDQASSDLGTQLTGETNPFRKQAAAGLSQSPQQSSPTVVQLPKFDAAEASTTVTTREASDQHLLTARRALSVGDVAQAELNLNQAKTLQVAYQANEDSPERLEASIHEGKRLAELRKHMNSMAGGEAAWRDGYAKFLVQQSEALIAWGDLKTAKRSAEEAGQLHPHFSQRETSPQDLLARIDQLQKAGRAAPQPNQLDAAGNESQVVQASMDLALDADLTLDAPTGETPAEVRVAQLNPPRAISPNALEGNGGEVLPLPKPGSADPYELLKQGEQLLRSGERAAALDSFREAFEQKDALDLTSQQRLQSHLQMLSVAPAKSRETPAGPPAVGGSLLDSANSDQSVLARQVWADVSKRQSEANKIRESDPMRSKELLTEAQGLIENSGLDSAAKRRLLTGVTISLEATEKYLHDHQAELDLEAANKSVLDDNERRRLAKVEVSERIAELVDQYNKLSDEHRDAEAEVVANRLYELAPEELVARQIWRQAKLIRRERLNQDIIAQSEDGVVDTFLGIRESAARGLHESSRDITYDSERWKDIAKRQGASDSRSRLSPRELEIQQKLKNDVSVSYNEMPLAAVIDSLSDITGVNIYLDPLGMGQEGVRSDTPITLDLKRDVSLKSALQLILEPLHLTYTIKDEVLKITSEQIRDGDVYQKVYNVADLVIPIPNFVPSTNMGLQGLVNNAVASQVYSGAGGGSPGPMAIVGNDRRGVEADPLGNNQLAQFGGPGSGSTSAPIGSNTPGGGAASADFDSLIDLIISTVEHDSWMENGTGEGEIQPFPTNLSLVVSQTQRVHEQIVDLLEQLRRLQDLQVTIEVRFIRLTDNFFERIGIDFDLNIEDNIPFTPQIESDGSYAPNQPSANIGLLGPTDGTAPPLFNMALDTQFRQSTFALSTPQFGTPSDLATFGFAILSDIEAYFFITASQGDRRANTLNAPKVTLFNGQQAVVVDTAFVPFVISVIPVVGEFAAAQQPVIVVLSEGTMMTVQAVVSDDRRYVRLTLVPFFSQIGEVREFTFDGSETTSSSSSSTSDDDGNDESNDDSELTTRSGTTVQLPTFQVISVSTTVSVPDGGTVLLGGIKRLREGRNEFGVPLLSKVPYLDRLFRNVGIGRETDSLMMMVTPHIIIPEEEEERLGLSNN